MSEADLTSTVVTAPRVPAAIAGAQATTRSPKKRPPLWDTWWRYIVAVVA